MKSLLRPLLVLSACLPLISQGLAQGDIAIPGTPKGDLRMELLQSRAFCKGIEFQLGFIEKHYPALVVETTAAKAT
jgi:hypothetical protein